MASAVGHISGGHFNPAVTLGFLVTRRIEPLLAGVYWVSQFLGALLAAALLTWLLPGSSVDATKLGVPQIAQIGAGEGLVRCVRAAARAQRVGERLGLVPRAGARRRPGSTGL